MIICPAQPFDLPAVMTIEHSAFIPQVQEKRRVLEERLELFPEGFFVLADTSAATVQQHGSALTAGYFCSERWAALPQALQLAPEAGKAALAVEPLPTAHAKRQPLPQEAKQLAQCCALGHKPRHTHRRDGSVLYVSSFALLPQYRGRGLGLSFFRAALAALCCAHSRLQHVVLVVSEEWPSARRIYDALGFVPLARLSAFFPSLHKKRADGIVMTATADSFRALTLVTNDNGLLVI